MSFNNFYKRLACLRQNFLTRNNHRVIANNGTTANGHITAIYGNTTTLSIYHGCISTFNTFF